MMFGKFTERAQKVLALAQEEAVRLESNSVGTEHILLGLLREEDGIAAKALSELGLNSNKINKEVERLTVNSSKKDGYINYTPRAKKVIELAMDEARKLGHSYVGTEHILLGLIREGEGIAARVFNNLGISLNRARQQVLKLLGSNETSKSKGASSNNVNTPNLDAFAKDLNELAREGKIDPVIGRSKEIKRVIEILGRRTKNNPVLIGEPGVGKTAIAEGLALLIENGEVPETLLDKRVMSLSMGTMVSGTKYRGEFEDRLKKTMDEISLAGNIILFIDEIHTIIGAGDGEGAVDAANIFKPALARGDMQCVGATTLDEYRKYFERDAALVRRFQPVQVDEPTVEESIQILNGLIDRYEAHHRVSYDKEAIVEAVKLSDRYITDRFLPDKAIDLIDEAGSKIRLNYSVAPSHLKDLEAKLEEARKEKVSSVHAQEFERAANLRDKEMKLQLELDELKNDWKDKQGSGSGRVTVEDIADVVSRWTGIPLTKIVQEESEKLINMESILHSRVVGQEDAVQVISKAVRRSRAGLSSGKKPIGSFIFLGPTGVGKTELARALAESMFGDEDSMIRIDMSEYMEKHSVSRLVGAPPGYVGYEEGGQLTEKVRRKPYSVVLLDEIEKAHPDVFNLLLQVLDDGRLTDSKGRSVDFTNTVIIMTSNVGATSLKANKYVGFNVGDSDREHTDMKDRVMADLKKTFRPEFINRIDEAIVFHALERKHLKEIVNLLSNQLVNRLKENGMDLEITEKAKDKILDDGYDVEYGARPLRRSIQKNVEDLLSEELLKGNIKSGDKVVVDVKRGKLVVK